MTDKYLEVQTSMVLENRLERTLHPPLETLLTALCSKES